MRDSEHGEDTMDRSEWTVDEEVWFARRDAGSRRPPAMPSMPPPDSRIDDSVFDRWVK